MWEITKRIDFCYGHRVYTQTLNSEYSVSSQCACRHLHGHQGHLHVELQGEELDGNGMVTDFKHLNWLKKWVDIYLDHRMILDINDPALQMVIPYAEKLDFKGIFAKTSNDKYMTAKPVASEFNLEGDYHNYTQTELEIIQGVTLVDFVPTSENLAKWIYTFTQEIMSYINVDVSKVTLFETPKSKAVYFENT